MFCSTDESTEAFFSSPAKAKLVNIVVNRKKNNFIVLCAFKSCKDEFRLYYYRPVVDNAVKKVHDK